MIVQALKGPPSLRVLGGIFLHTHAGQPMTVYGSGEQTRSFCFVDDTIAGLMALMASNEVTCLPRGGALRLTAHAAARRGPSTLGTPRSAPSRRLLL